MFRKTQTILGLALCVAALTSLSACGQKGDLVLPSAKPQVLPRGPASAPKAVASAQVSASTASTASTASPAARPAPAAAPALPLRQP